MLSVEDGQVGRWEVADKCGVHRRDSKLLEESWALNYGIVRNKESKWVGVV